MTHLYCNSCTYDTDEKIWRRSRTKFRKTNDRVSNPVPHPKGSRYLTCLSRKTENSQAGKRTHRGKDVWTKKITRRQNSNRERLARWIRGIGLNTEIPNPNHPGYDRNTSSDSRDRSNKLKFYSTRVYEWTNTNGVQLYGTRITIQTSSTSLSQSWRLEWW